MLTFFIDLEGIQACGDSSRDGPHSCPRHQKGRPLLRDVHEASDVGSRILGRVFAGSVLSKGKGKRLDATVHLLGNMSSRQLTGKGFPSQFVVTHPRS